MTRQQKMNDSRFLAEGTPDRLQRRKIKRGAFWAPLGRCAYLSSPFS
jgi:hypothetical protein